MTAPGTAFVDESRRNPTYLLCASVVVDQKLPPARRALRSMVAPGQRRLHFSSESDTRRRKILGQMADLDVSAIIYSILNEPDVVARRLILNTMVPDLKRRGVSRLVLESRESQDARDRTDLYRLVGPNPQPDFAYEHRTPTREPLLWVPDAVGWAWGRGGDWRRRIDRLGLITDTVDILAS